MFPDRINNKTNGITPRRWLHAVQPGADLRSSPRRSATGFLDDIDALRELEPHADDPAFQDALRAG